MPVSVCVNEWNVYVCVCAWVKSADGVRECGHRPGGRFGCRPVIVSPQFTTLFLLKTRSIIFIFRTRSSRVHNTALSPASCPGRVDLSSGSYVRKSVVVLVSCPA